MVKYTWELEELDPKEGTMIPYVVKRLREDDDGDLVFKKIYAADWKEALLELRNSLNLLEKNLTAQEEPEATKKK
jgi:hypothetical protein